jgi:hypothetical protein
VLGVPLLEWRVQAPPACFSVGSLDAAQLLWSILQHSLALIAAFVRRARNLDEFDVAARKPDCFPFLPNALTFHCSLLWQSGPAQFQLEALQSVVFSTTCPVLGRGALHGRKSRKLL